MISPIGTTKRRWFYHPYTQGLLRWGWVVLALAVTGTALYYMIKTTTEQHPPISMRIEQPDFYSVSANGHPYHIHAESIQSEKSGQFVFFKPWALYDWFTQKLTLSSGMGYWNDPIQILTLEKNVRIHDDQGNRMHSEFVQVLYQKKEINSHKTTTGTGPKGHFKASGFSWTTQALHLHGPVSLTVHTLGPSEQQKATSKSRQKNLTSAAAKTSHLTV